MKNKILKSILEEKWLLSYERRMGFHMMYLFYIGLYKDFKQLFGHSSLFAIYRVNNSVAGAGYLVSDTEIIKNNIQKRLRDSSFIKMINGYLKERFDGYKEYGENVIESYIMYSNDNLITALRKHMEVEELISAPSWILFTFFEESLTERITHEIGSETVTRLAVKTKTTPLEEYNLYLLKHGPQKTLKKYPYLGMFDFFFESKDIEFHNDNHKNLKDKYVSVEDYQKILKEELQQNKKTYSQIRKQFKQNADLINLFETYSNLKEWKNGWREKVSFKLLFLMKEIAKRTSLSLEGLALCTYEEIEKMLQGNIEGLRTLQSELVLRQKKSAFVFYKDISFAVTENNFLDRFDALMKEKDISEIKGSSAFKGVVQGVVKIVLSPLDFGKVNDGDILVSSTTRPDFLPVMQKVKGFVTNEGGLLSHAAIVARELKKPCIIGTKIATKVLKDGDLVEVDAEKGVVRVIKRA